MPDTRPLSDFNLVPVAKDGNCQFSAIAAGMFDVRNSEAVQWGKVLREGINDLLCGLENPKWMTKWKNSLAAQIEAAAASMMRKTHGYINGSHDYTSYRSYCTEVKTNPSAFGYDATLLALSKMLERRIVVYIPDGKGKGDISLVYDTFLAFGKTVNDPPIYLRLLPQNPPHYDLLVLKSDTLA